METEKYQTGLKRVWAAVVDSIVFMPFLLIDYWIVNYTTNNYIIILWQAFTVFIPIFYSIILHYRYGQTIGKWVVGVKVLDLSETKKITIKQAFFRDSFYLMSELMGFTYFLVLALRTGELQYLLTNLNDFGGTSFLVWTLLELASMMANKKRRAIHDFLAKSVVVRID